MDPTNSLGIQNLSCKINKIKYLKALVKNKAGFPYKYTLRGEGYFRISREGEGSGKGGGKDLKSAVDRFL